MSNPRAEGFSWASPYITVADVGKAIQFYQAAFGFKPHHSEPETNEEGQIDHAELVYQDQVFMFGCQGAFGGESQTPKNSGVLSPVQMYLYCKNVDEFYEQAVKAGATSIAEPQNMFWGDRMCVLADDDGHRWSWATNIRPCR